MESGFMEVAEIDLSEEKKIAIGVIISTPFLREIQAIHKPGYFQITYLDYLCKLCFDFFDQYAQAPGRQISDLFEAKRLSKENVRDPARAKNIEDFLERLDEEYLEDDTFNVDYYLDKAKRYFAKRVLVKTGKDMVAFANADRIEEGVELFNQPPMISPQVSNVVSATDQEKAKGKYTEEDSVKLFTMESRGVLGKVGKLMGPFERGQLVSYLGAMKVGKSFFLQETAVQAVENGLKALFVSLEMNQPTLDKRLDSRITAASNPERSYQQTVFDCERNQYGDCSMGIRTNAIPLFTDDKTRRRSGRKGDSNPILNRYENLEEVEGYKPCTVCRERGYNSYALAYWTRLIRFSELNLPLLLKKYGAFERLYGKGRLRSVCFPAYSASVNDLRSTLVQLEYLDWLPDVLVIDYADILAPEDHRESYRDSLNRTWQFLKQLALEKNILIVTASQTNREAIKKDTFGTTNLAEDIRKAGVVDSMFGIQQSDKEKSWDVVRLNCLLHRHQEYNQQNFLVITQNLSIAYPMLDAEWLSYGTYNKGRFGFGD